MRPFDQAELSWLAKTVCSKPFESFSFTTLVALLVLSVIMQKSTVRRPILKFICWYHSTSSVTIDLRLKGSTAVMRAPDFNPLCLHRHGLLL